MTLQEALRKAANGIVSGKFAYDWTISCSCNCGVLAYVADDGRSGNLDHFSDKLDQEMPVAPWSGPENACIFRCPITKMPPNSIIASLRRLGIKKKDIHHLEWLSNRRIRTLAGLPISLGPTTYGDCDQWSAVVRYMRAWANMLDTDAEKVASAPVEDVVYQQITSKTEEVMV